MATAHLMVQLDTSVFPPFVCGAGIYSEGAMSITTMGKRQYAEIMTMEGKSYLDAKDKVIDTLKYMGDHYAWLLYYVDDTNEKADLERGYVNKINKATHDMLLQRSRTKKFKQHKAGMVHVLDERRKAMQDTLTFMDAIDARLMQSLKKEASEKKGKWYVYQSVKEGCIQYRMLLNEDERKGGFMRTRYEEDGDQLVLLHGWCLPVNGEWNMESVEG